jgi:HAD superfamily hydrolase (TIGR01490 family)
MEKDCAMNERKRIGAFFDFDGTLIDAESGRIGFKYLYDMKEIPFFFLLKVLASDFLYQRNLISDTRMAATMLQFYKKRDLKVFEAEADAFYHTHLKPHLAPTILAMLSRHRREGHTLVLISASIRYMLKPAVKDLGFGHLLCTDLETGADGTLTGNPKGPICIADQKRVAAVALSNRIGIDMDQSYAYGNHHSDIPLLEAVGNPIAVEPSLTLKKHAQKKNWPILNFTREFE